LIIFGYHTLTYLVAAIDLGSNSFHATLVDTGENPYRVVSRAGEKVQLAAGLDNQGHLSQEAMDRGLDCLRRLAPKLIKVDPNNLHVVATNTLRVAQNSADFISQAEAILGVPIRVLTGDEEALLIFSGVVGEVSSTTYQQRKKLVIDIGGGSTELILGQRIPQRLQSFPMGCVAFSGKFFPQRKIKQSYITNAVEAAQNTIEKASLGYFWDDWQVCIGSSGTVKALAALSALEEDGRPYLDLASMAKIERQLLAFDHLDEVLIEGLRPDRGEVLPAGYAILKGIMLSLKLDRIYFSTGALREGVLLHALQQQTDSLSGSLSS
jgi:exopolyphosphatase/guanosine-5'-triphosphate,3'-diphosphate pyrophosphatase